MYEFRFSSSTIQFSTFIIRLRKEEIERGRGRKRKKRDSSSPNKLGKEFAVNFDAIRRRAGASNVVVA